MIGMKAITYERFHLVMLLACALSFGCNIGKLFIPGIYWVKSHFRCQPELQLRSNEDDDILWSLVKDLQFLKYEHSIEQMKPSRVSFPAEVEHTEVCDFSAFGMDVIKDFLHIGMVSEDSFIQPVNRNQVLLLVWPRFVSPTAYRNRKQYLPGLKKIKTVVFRVPESVFLKYSHDKVSLNEIIVATAILTPVDEWKLLERMVISSLYHLTFDKPTTDSNGDINVWQNYSQDRLDKGWKQLLFLCCGPQGLAYLVKRMLKRNWARIAREATSKDVTSNDSYNLFCTESAVQLLIKWAKFSFKQDVLLKFLEELNIVRPAIDSVEIVKKIEISFASHSNSCKKHRCTLCPYESDDKTYFRTHIRTHTGEKPFICEVCKCAFSYFSLLNRHRVVRHLGNYPYHCKYCAKPHWNISSLKYHLKVHENRGTLHFKCNKCSHIFKDEIALKDHMPFHSEDPIFECAVCLKTLDSETALLAHSRNHDKVKPFNCHICGKGFLTTSGMTKHYNSSHSDSRASFPCRFCAKELASNDSRRRHEASKPEEQSKV